MRHLVIVCILAASAAADPRSQYTTLAASLTKTKDPDLAASLAKIGKDKPAALASSAAALAAVGRTQAALAYLGKAALLDPKDPNTANNLGITLELAGDSKGAALALRYAQDLAPESVIVLVNLAAVVHDNAKAEELLKKALKMDPSSCEATASIGLVYEMEQKDDEATKALESALRCHPSQQLRDALMRIKMRHLGSKAPPRPPSDVPPLVPFPFVPEPPPLPKPGEPPPVVERDLVVPAFPDWKDVWTFLLSVPQTKAWGDDLGVQLKAVMDDVYKQAAALVKEKAAYHPLSPRTDPATKVFDFPYSDEPAKAALKDLEQSYSMQLTRLGRTYQDAVTALDRPFNTDPKHMPWSDCHEKVRALEREYQDWRALTHTYYDATMAAMIAYYADTAQVIATIHDPAERGLADDTRKVFVLAHLTYGFPLEWTLTRPMFYLSGTNLIAACGDDSSGKPDKEPDRVKIEDAKAGQCQQGLAKQYLSLDLYMVRVKYDCNEVQIGVDSGLYTGSGKYNWNTGELTLFGGVRFRAFNAVSAATGISLTAKGGVYATFDTHTGQIVSAGLNESLSLKVNAGGSPVTGGIQYEVSDRQDLVPAATMLLMPFGQTALNVRPPRP